MRLFVSGAALCVAASATLGIGCADTAFIQATTSYAAAESQTATALAGVQATITGACESKARSNFVQAHLGTLPGGDISWESWMTKATATPAVGTKPAVTWADYCTQLSNTASGAQTYLKALGKYAGELKTLAGDATYNGANVTTLTSTASTVVGKLAGSSDPAATAIKDSAAPFNTLAGYVAQVYVSGDLKKAVTDAAKPVNAITAGLASYFAAVAAALATFEKSQLTTLTLLEASLKLDNAAGSADAEKLLVYDHYAAAVDAEIATTKATLAGYQAAVTSLQKANQALAAAATKSDNKVELQAALGLVEGLVSDLVTLASATSAKGS